MKNNGRDSLPDWDHPHQKLVSPWIYGSVADPSTYLKLPKEEIHPMLTLQQAVLQQPAQVSCAGRDSRVRKSCTSPIWGLAFRAGSLIFSNLVSSDS